MEWGLFTAKGDSMGKGLEMWLGGLQGGHSSCPHPKHGDLTGLRLKKSEGSSQGGVGAATGH